MEKNDKIKEILSKLLTTIIDYKKYIASGVVLVVISLLLLSSNANEIRLFPKIAKKSVKEIEKIDTNIDNTQENTFDENPLIENKDKKLNKFIKNYYKAIEKADIEKIRKYVDVLSDIEVNSIRQKAIAREGHKNIKVYTKNGPEPDSYLAYVYLELKFKNIKTLVPGVEPLYIKKDDDGFVIINSMNSSAKDLEFTNEAELAEDVVQLLENTNEAYKKACSKDKELVKMLEENGYDVPDFDEEDKPDGKDDKDNKNDKDTQSEVKPKEDKDKDNKDKKPDKSTVNDNQSKPKDDNKPSDKDKTPKSKKDNKNGSLIGKTYILKDGVRLRSKKSTKSLVKASGIKDDRVRVVKEYSDSKWVKVELIAAGEGTYGYMKKDVLLDNAKLKK